MKTHFVKLRRLLSIASILAPTLYFAAFLCCAQNLLGLAAVLVALSMISLFVFPHQLGGEPRSPEPKSKISSWMSYLVTLLFVYWLMSLPEVWAFMDRMDSSKALWDWRLILAVFAWQFHWGYSMYQKAAKLKDREIVEFYGDEANPETNQAD